MSDVWLQILDRNWLTFHGLMVVFGLVIYVLASLALHQHRHPSAAIAWVVMLTLLPYVALPLYFMFGSRKLRFGQRLAPAEPVGDGKQTPLRGHPIFLAQHATATCCRSCLAKWHGIAAKRPMSRAEKDHVLAVLAYWLARAPAGEAAEPKRQPDLFESG